MTRLSPTNIYELPVEWAPLPQTPVGWMHSGIAVVDEKVVVAHPAEPRLLFYDDRGTLAQTLLLDELLEPHGFCLALGGGLWIGDVGFKRRVAGSDFATVHSAGRVVLVDNDGRIVRELVDPGSDWSPTSIAVVVGRGDVWVADGYGQSVVHRFDSDGRLQQTLSGEEGAGRFDCPHGVLVDRRRDEAELYVSDRANGRIQVFDLDGHFRRVVGAGVVVTPTDMTLVGDLLALTDFTQSRVTILDVDDRLLEHIGANPSAAERDGWPNARDLSGDLVRPALEEGLFNSPHTLAADTAGNLYATEWLLGGRLTMLKRR